MTAVVDESAQLAQVSSALVRHFAGRVPEETVIAAVQDEARVFDGARIRTFVPVLLQRKVTERLRCASLAEPYPSA
jgi:hypothetical protein